MYYPTYIHEDAYMVINIILFLLRSVILLTLVISDDYISV